ncbi:MAG: hypothetical protein WD335_01480 [Candidatus Paceibacterota bacterium]
MLKTKEWKYSDSKDRLTAQIKDLSLTELAEKYRSIKITWIRQLESEDVSREEIMSIKPNAGIYRVDTVLHKAEKTYDRQIEAEKTYEKQVEKIPLHWSFPDPSTLIQIDQMYGEVDELPRNLLKNQKIWTSFTVPGAGKQSVDVPMYGRVWCTSINGKKQNKQYYRLELLYPENKLAARTAAIYVKKIR